METEADQWLLGAGVRRMEGITKGSEHSILGNEMFYNYGDGCTTLCTYKKTMNFTLQVNTMILELYFNKATIIMQCVKNLSMEK